MKHVIRKRVQVIVEQPMENRLVQVGYFTDKYTIFIILVIFHLKIDMTRKVTVLSFIRNYVILLSSIEQRLHFMATGCGGSYSVL